MRYLVNALSINMLPESCDVSIRRIALNIAQRLAFDAVNAIDHESTAAVVGRELTGEPLPAARSTVMMQRGDALLVAQYRGPRLPEGATELPDGSEIAYYSVELGDSNRVAYTNGYCNGHIAGTGYTANPPSNPYAGVA